MHNWGVLAGGVRKNKMLQRVYAVSFFNPRELKAYLRSIELAKERDHRKLGKQLELFHFEESSPGRAIFYAQGCIWSTTNW